MLRRSQTLLLTFLTVAFCGLAAHASAKDFVLEDWDGPAPVKSWYSNPSLDTNGWVSAVSDPRTFGTWTGATWWAPRGLYATARFALFAGPGTGEWQWQAPGSSTVYRAEYGPVITHTVGCVNEGMRTSTGAWQPTVNGAPGAAARTSAHPTACTPGAWVPWTPSGRVFIGPLGRQVFCSTAGCGRTGSPTGNRAVFGVQRTRAVQPQFDAYLPGARLYLTDYDKPTITAGTNSLTGWVNAGTGSVTATVTDAGLGVKSVTITGPTPLAGSPATKTTTLSCTGDRNDRCPASWNTSKPNTTASLGYDVATLPEGVNPFSAAATDIVDNVSTANTTAIPPVKIDRTAPGSITATGPLVDDDDRYFNGTDPVELTVTATDPAAANGQSLSGIQTIRIDEVGGRTLATRAVTCNAQADECPAAANETLTAAVTELSEGAHQLHVVVTDRAGNTASGAPWTVYVDRTPPPISGSAIDAIVDEGDGIADLAWDPVDDPGLPGGQRGSGLAGYQVRVRAVGEGWSAAEAIAPSDFPTVELGSYQAGQEVEYEIVARDIVGNSAVQTRRTAVALTDVTAGEDGEYAPGEAGAAIGSADPGEPASWRDVDPEGEIVSDGASAGLRTSGTVGVRSGDAITSASVLYDTALCSRGGSTSPCGQYSGRKAAAYAREFARRAIKRNRDYESFDSDCTNFASQVLHFGGMHFFRTAPGINDPRHGDMTLYVKGKGSWWSHRLPSGIPDQWSYRTSTSWSVAWVLYNQLRDNGLARIVGSDERLRAGDLIFYWWNGRGQAKEINHITVVAGVRKRRMYIAQHTIDRFETLRRHQERVRGSSPNAYRVVLRPVATRFDLQ